MEYLSYQNAELFCIDSMLKKGKHQLLRQTVQGERKNSDGIKMV
jgi:hypothetical protein